MPKQAERRGLLWPAVLTVCGCAILISLGVWQLERRAWKEALIADIDARADAAPQPLPAEAQWPHLNPDDYDYRHVEAHGHFDYEKEALVFRPSGPENYGPGFLVLTPLRLDSGAIVIVNRGYIRQEHKEPGERGQVPGEVTIKGLMRPPEPRNMFTPADEPAKGIYFTRDPTALAAHFQLARVAPFSIDADATQDATGAPGGWPKGGATVRTFPNNHLEYALTWFGLAAGLVGVFLTLVLNRRQERGQGMGAIDQEK
jgi:surfeit locus 1 family protein